MGNLDLDRDTAQFHLLIAPVKLECVSGIVFKGDEDLGRGFSCLHFPLGDIASNCIVTAGISLPLKLFKQNLCAAAVLDRFGFVFFQQLHKTYNKLTKLGTGLVITFVALLSLAVTDDRSDGVALSLAKKNDGN
jgi:hypothetical protein